MSTPEPLTPTWRVEAMSRLLKGTVTAELNNGGHVQGCFVPEAVVDPETGLINPALNTYQKVNVCGVSYQAHAAKLAITLNRHLEPGEIATHLCNNPACRSPEHITLGTQKQNMEYAVECNRIARGTRNGHSTCPEKTPRGDTHYRSHLRGNERQIALELIKKYRNQRGYALALAEYLEVSKDTIYNLARTKDYLASDVAISDIELSFGGWVPRKEQKYHKPSLDDLEKIVRAIRQGFHDSPDYAKATMMTYLAHEYDYSEAWIRKILKRDVYPKMAEGIPIPTYFGIGSRRHNNGKFTEDL
jgi:hypothetical protein